MTVRPLACAAFFFLRREGRLYLQWLLGQLALLGGVVLQQRVTSLHQLAGYDAVINCSGEACVGVGAWREY
jgi:hypothetical protein